MKYIFILLTSMLLFSCATSKQTAKDSKELTANDNVIGKVESIDRGKDGYTAKIITNEGKIYHATISVSNLEDPKQYKDAEIGMTIQVQGEHWSMEGENYMTVRKLLFLEI